MQTEVVANNGDVLVAQFDEFDEVYGCVANDELVRCYNCTWESCPMRGGKKEVA